MKSYSSPLVEKLAGILWDAARSQRLVHYSQIAPMVGEVAYSIAFWAMLGEVSTVSQEQAGVLLSAIVVNKHDGFPGPSFFTLAEDLGRSVNDKLEFWAREVQTVFAKAVA